MANQEAQDGSAQGMTHEFFQACIEFYHLNPLLGGFGFVVLISTVPMFLLLRYSAKMKRIDNDMVVSKLRLQLQAESQKGKSRGKGKKKARTQSPASTTTTGG